MLLWLQGGPGGTSMFGLFVEHGPYFVHKNLTCEHKHSYAYEDQHVHVFNILMGNL